MTISLHRLFHLKEKSVKGILSSEDITLLHKTYKLEGKNSYEIQQHLERQYEMREKEFFTKNLKQIKI